MLTNSQEETYPVSTQTWQGHQHPKPFPVSCTDYCPGPYRIPESPGRSKLNPNTPSSWVLISVCSMSCPELYLESLPMNLTLPASNRVLHSGGPDAGPVLRLHPGKLHSRKKHTLCKCSCCQGRNKQDEMRGYKTQSGSMIQ